MAQNMMETHGNTPPSLPIHRHCHPPSTVTAVYRCHPRLPPLPSTVIPVHRHLTLRHLTLSQLSFQHALYCTDRPPKPLCHAKGPPQPDHVTTFVSTSAGFSLPGIQRTDTPPSPAYPLTKRCLLRICLVRRWKSGFSLKVMFPYCLSTSSVS